MQSILNRRMSINPNLRFSMTIYVNYKYYFFEVLMFWWFKFFIWYKKCLSTSTALLPDQDMYHQSTQHDTWYFVQYWNIYISKVIKRLVYLWNSMVLHWQLISQLIEYIFKYKMKGLFYKTMSCMLFIVDAKKHFLHF